MNIRKKESGSMIAEISAIIAAIGILTLIGTSYYSLIVAKAQFTEGFVTAQPLISYVNDFYAGSGTLGSTGNLIATSLFDNDSNTSGPQDYVGRFIKSAEVYSNGVVAVTFNELFQFTDNDNLSGTVNNVSSILAGEKLLFIPTYAVEDSSNGPAPFLKWVCATTLDNDTFTGDVFASLSSSTPTQNRLSMFGEGCLVISAAQASNAIANNTLDDYENVPDALFD